MAKKTVNESFNVSYVCRERTTNDDVRTVNMNWENRTVDEIMDNLNTWLTAIGHSELVVTRKDSK